ncbi:MAG: pitrilysin family protein, partial [Desulfobacterales bacterium]
MRLDKFIILSTILLVFAGNVHGVAETAYDLNINVNAFQLENGFQVLVVERPATPQVACRLAIRAGSALEQAGKTGIAHLLEHMMFKGTKNFGTIDYQKDQQLQDQIEAAYQTVLSEQSKREPDLELIRKKQAEMNDLRLKVQEIYVPQAFSSQLGKNGTVGVNAFTTKDQTQYIASVPSDMLEQWFSIVSEQLFEPAWREFYVEKEVVQREWAFRYINNPGGAAWLDLSAAAYTAHPYRNPTIGWKADMEKYSTQDAIAFHQTWYNPSNAVLVLVGDVTLENARRLAEIYFQRYPAGQRAPEKVTREPAQQGPRKSVRYLKGARTPLVRIGFHGAAMDTNDFYALDAMTMVLSQGRSARLTQGILNKGQAQEAWAYNPDNRYGGMIILGGSPNEPKVVKNEGVSAE